jgi:hypothetical protein
MRIEVSNGDIVDKFTIILIKLDKIKNEDKLVNIKIEYSVLLEAIQKIGINQNSKHFDLLQELKIVNQKLWEIEDEIRDKERLQEFDKDFINLARSVYYLNDERADIKRQVNLVTKSRFTEEKQYVSYK